MRVDFKGYRKLRLFGFCVNFYFLSIFNIFKGKRSLK